MREDSWILTVWGVRGSVPTAMADRMEYGGGTSCISVDAGGELVVFDAGSGLPRLGRSLLRRGGPRRLHLLLGHLHIDHLVGLFAFPPLHDPDMDIRIWGPAGTREALDRLIRPPYWPLELADFPARLSLREIGPGETLPLAGDLALRTMAGRHPGGGLLYRLETEGKSVTYALDCELDETLAGPLAEFARNTDVLVWDANFAPEDLRPGWGHSTWEQGIGLGRAAGAKTVLMAHYSWEYADAFLQEQERAAAGFGGVRFAREMMEIRL